MTPELQSLADLVANVGVWVVFLGLFIQERKEHADTRKSLYREIEAARLDHMSDLREIANMREKLHRVQGTVQEFRAVELARDGGD